MDEELTGQMKLTSANSINLARFLPQAFYYFRAWAQLEPGTKAFFSVPSGNYGNMTAGLVAREMGLPVHTFLSVNNLNDVVASYLLTGNFKPRPSTPTIANAMDVGDPSNFDRILDLFNHRHDWITRHMQGYSDTEEIREVSEVYRKTGYLCDPHGATGYQAALLPERASRTNRYLSGNRPSGQIQGKRGRSDRGSSRTSRKSWLPFPGEEKRPYLFNRITSNSVDISWIKDKEAISYLPLGYLFSCILVARSAVRKW